MARGTRLEFNVLSALVTVVLTGVVTHFCLLRHRAWVRRERFSYREALGREIELEWFDRRRRRIDAGRCPECGYDLRHDHGEGCPECGWNRPP